MNKLFTFGVYLDIQAKNYDDAVDMFNFILDNNKDFIFDSYNFEIKEIER
jgi:hypothetical protein